MLYKLTFLIVGFDTPNAKWQVVGTAETRISTTSIADTGLAMASLSHLAFTKPEDVPDFVCLSGHSVSFQEARDIFSAAKGIDISLTCLDDAELKQSVLAAHASAKLSDPAYIIVNDIKYVITPNLACIIPLTNNSN